MNTTPLTQKIPHLNYDFLEAKPIILPNYKTINFYLIGCGGTGSWLAPTICRLARLFTEQEKAVRVTFIDFDIVESSNIIRQNFCEQEIGLNKAQTLSLRYSLAWGIKIGAIPKPFAGEMIERDWSSLTLLIGCVDNAKARQAIAETLENYQFFYSSLGTSLWWLDCGNHATSGQILLGSHLSNDLETYQFHSLGCVKLPAPCVQHPELLIPRQEEGENHNLSCAQLALLNAQSLGINQKVAAEAAEYLIQLTTGKLKRFATYFDLISGSAQSLYITQSSVIQAIQK